MSRPLPSHDHRIALSAGAAQDKTPAPDRHRRGIERAVTVRQENRGCLVLPLGRVEGRRSTEADGQLPLFNAPNEK
jgi:hypothetical protein